MKVDAIDNTLVCNYEDLQTVLAYFKDDRKIPEYLEKSILEIVLEQLLGKSYKFETVDEYLMQLPDDFVKKAITDINSMFFNYSKVTYRHNHLSYLLYYLPANVFKVWKPLLDLQLKNTLKSHVRILDIGTGPGSIPIGIIEFYKALAENFADIQFDLTFVLIDAEQEFLNIAVKMIRAVTGFVPRNLTIDVEFTLCERVCEENDYSNIGEFDIITMSNFLTSNEGENQANAVAMISKLKNNMKYDGSFIIIEPGEQNSCKALKTIRNEIVNNKILNIFSPCIGIWKEKVAYNCACFNMVRCFWQIPVIYKYLCDRGLHKAKRENVPFNYVVFRKDNVKKYAVVKNSRCFTKLADLKKNVGGTVNIIALIRTAIYKDDRLAFSLCDGSCSFSEDSKSVWVNISTEWMKQNGFTVPLIAGERIKLNRVLVKSKGEGIELEITESSKIIVDY